MNEIVVSIDIIEKTTVFMVITQMVPIIKKIHPVCIKEYRAQMVNGNHRITCQKRNLKKVTRKTRRKNLLKLVIVL